jgi:hypothetical protein
MANAQEKIEQQEEADAVADKAKEIGKDVGVEEEKKEEIPDYEVIEEDDKPLAKEREERPKVERKQLTNKEKRDLRKKRVAEKFQQKDAIIEQQQQAINQLTGRLNDFEGRLSNVDRAKVDDMLTAATVNFSRAEKEHMDAFKEGDAEKATRSMKAMYAAQRQIDQLKPIKQQMETRQPMQRQESSAADPVVTRKANDWAAKHEWYRADGSDEDSEIAKAISGKMVNEGFDPRSDDFWDELDDRLEKRGVGIKEDDEEDEYEERAPVVRKRASPPVSGGSKRGDVGGKIQVTLPTAYINILKERGDWSDPVRKAKMIRRYLDGLKQNQE